jgi:archaeal flagellin FlaB
MWKKLIKNDKGFTGLEAAIVLIAFVVVAAVFSYVMLGAGFFTTQKSQQVVHTGVTQASSSVELSGDVTALGTAGAQIDKVNLTLQLAAGGSPVDMSNSIIVYSSGKTEPTELTLASDTTPVDGANYAITAKYNGNEDNILDKGEKFDVQIIITDESIGANQQFQLQIIPPSGAPYIISRTAPPAISKVMTLY